MDGGNPDESKRRSGRPLWLPAVFGAVAVPAAAISLMPQYPGSFGILPSTNVAILIAMIGASFLAAWLFGCSRTFDGPQAADESQQVARRGLQVGMLAFVSGAAGLAVAWLLGRIGVLDAPIFLHLPDLYEVMGLCVLPAAFLSILGARLAAALSSAPEAAPVFDDDPGELSSGRKRITADSLVMAILIVAGLASPALRPLLEPKPVIVKKEVPKPAPVVPVPVVKPIPEPEPEPEPSFLFVPPPGLATASPRQFHIAEIRTVAGPEASDPLALAPDNRHVAFNVNGGIDSTIRVVDLHTLTDTATFPHVENPRALAWSPDSKQLAILRNHPTEPLGIASMESQRIAWLSRPAPAQIPNVPDVEMTWWHDDHLAFLCGEQFRLLELSTLQVSFHKDGLGAYLAEHFDEEAMDRVWVAAKFGKAMPTSNTWAFSTPFGLPKVDLGADPEMPLAVSAESYFRIVSLAIDSTQPLPGSENWPGTNLRFASDGSLTLSLSREGLRVLYIGLRENPASGFRIRTELTPNQETEDLIERQQLTALICPPLVNSYNGECVGGDLTRILGLARVARWDEDGIAFWIDDALGEITSNDIVTCFCRHTKKQLIPLSDHSFREWWAAIAPTSADPECAPPPRSDFNAPVTVEESPAMVAYLDQDQDDFAIESDLSAFLVAHYYRIVAEDAEGFANEFIPTPTIDGKRTSREKILAEFKRSQDEWDTPSETIISFVELERLMRSQYRARFSVSRKADGPGKGLDEQFDVTVVVEIVDGSPLISSQTFTRLD